MSHVKVSGQLWRWTHNSTTTALAPAEGNALWTDQKLLDLSPLPPSEKRSFSCHSVHSTKWIWVETSTMNLRIYGSQIILCLFDTKEMRKVSIVLD